MKTRFKAKDEYEALRLLKSENMANCLDEIISTIRRKHIKYSNYNEEQQKVADNIFEEINDCLNEYNINLEELFQ